MKPNFLVNVIDHSTCWTESNSAKPILLSCMVHAFTENTLPCTFIDWSGSHNFISRRLTRDADPALFYQLLKRVKIGGKVATESSS